MLNNAESRKLFSDFYSSVPAFFSEAVSCGKTNVQFFWLGVLKGGEENIRSKLTNLENQTSVKNVYQYVVRGLVLGNHTELI